MVVSWRRPISMTSNEIEEALQRILADSAGPPGLVVTLRRHEDYERLLLVIDDLRELNDRLRADITRMGHYSQLYMRAMDDLRVCKKLMDRAGLDTTFISSFSR